MIKEIEKLLKTNILNALYQRSEAENFIGINTRKLVNQCKLLLYWYPVDMNLLTEEEISDFYISTQTSVRNAIYNYNCKNLSFKIYYLNYIKIIVKYYKLKTNHDFIFNNLILEAIVNHSDTFEKETIYDDEQTNPVTIAKFKYKVVSEENSEYFEYLSHYKFDDSKSLKELFNNVINNVVSLEKEIKFLHIEKYREKMNKKSTRKNILLFLLTMPDAILENYVEEVSYLFSVKTETIVSLFSSCSELLQSKYKRYNKYTQLNNKHYKNYLISNYKLSSKIFEDSQVETSLNWNKKAMINNAQKIRKTLNMHVSQRTLAKELDINKGTVASSISAAKKLLQKANCAS